MSKPKKNRTSWCKTFCRKAKKAIRVVIRHALLCVSCAKRGEDSSHVAGGQRSRPIVRKEFSGRRAHSCGAQGKNNAPMVIKRSKSLPPMLQIRKYPVSSITSVSKATNDTAISTRRPSLPCVVNRKNSRHALKRSVSLPPTFQRKQHYPNCSTSSTVMEPINAVTTTSRRSLSRKAERKNSPLLVSKRRASLPPIFRYPISSTPTKVIITMRSKSAYSLFPGQKQFFEEKDEREHKGHDANAAAATTTTTTTTTTTQMGKVIETATALACADVEAEHGLAPETKWLHIIRRGRNGGELTPQSSTAINAERAKQLNLDRVESAYLSGGIVGIKNHGNTCFINCIIQCLSHTLELTDIFLRRDFPSGTICSEFKRAMQKVWLHVENSAKKKNPLPLSALSSATSQEIDESLKKMHKDSISLKKFVRNIAKQHMLYSSYDQQDAQEFFNFFIQSIHREIEPITRNKVEYLHPFGISDLQLAKNRWECYCAANGSPVADIFAGQYKSTLTCLKCGHKSYTFEPFWDCNLPLYGSHRGDSVHLSRCFGVFCQEETMSGDNQPMCSACDKLQPAAKRMTISRFPPILVIYLQRFHPMTLCKLDAAVTIPQHLDLTGFSSPETLESLTTAKVCYDLYAISNHIGTRNSGHYTADVKHFASQRWFNCNDRRVSVHSGTKFSQSEFQSKKAYMLFYRRSIVQ